MSGQSNKFQLTSIKSSDRLLSCYLILVPCYLLLEVTP